MPKPGRVLPAATRRARLVRRSPTVLRRLASALRRGELVAVPTETVYGLAANALDPAACERIFVAKGRPQTDPLIVHVPSLPEAEALADVSAAARRVAEAFWPGPLTMVLPKKAIVPDIVTSGLSSVAVRCPSHPVFRALLREARLPLAAPSANPFGYISPTTAEHVMDNLGDRIGYVLDGGPCAMGLESTILDLRDPKRPRVLRPGPITAEQIARVLKRPVPTRRLKKAAGSSAEHIQTAGEETQAQVAPGMLTRHYSPRTPLALVRRITTALRRRGGDSTAWLYFSRPSGPSADNVVWLSAAGDVREASRVLFARLRQLDRAGFDRIVAESAPDTPEGRALNDRLARAAAKR